ncbi:hypothetical protein Angca_003597 [Angiostrongylus cantonensis]|nr:hypothetical protein Angca_003597 [Angiostrongylus cantonensis]
MSLVSLKSKRWTRVRNQVAPAFSTGKVKLMIPIFNECSKICTKILDEYERHGTAVPIKDVITRLTLDMTSKCAFGYNFHVQNNSSSPFFHYAKKFSEFDLRSPEVALVILFPNICSTFQRLTGMSLINNAANKFFSDVLETMFKDRKTINGVVSYILDHCSFVSFKKFLRFFQERNDFFQILLDILVRDGDRIEESHLQSGKKGLTKGEIMGQAFMFVLAGFETTPAVLHLVLYMLAANDDIQRRCRDEIQRICGDEEQITYEMLNEMSYVEQCITETLRMYPPVVRWAMRNRHNRDPLTYVPFGYGPRNCIGMRVAQMQMKTALAHILRRYEMQPQKILELPLEIDSVGSMRTVEQLNIILTRI